MSNGWNWSHSAGPVALLTANGAYKNGIPVSTFYYHIRALRKKACEIPAAADTAVQKQEVVQIPLWKTEQDPAETAPLSMPSIRLQMQGVRIEIHEQAGAEVIRNTLLALRQLC